MNLLFPPMSTPLRVARIKTHFCKTTDTFVSHLCIKLEITKSLEVCNECSVDLEKLKPFDPFKRLLGKGVIYLHSIMVDEEMTMNG